MKILKILLCFFLSSVLARGAITEWYVNSAGSGTGDGVTEANAMSYATFVDYMSAAGSFTNAPGDRFNIKGGIARTTTSDTFVNGGTATSPVIIRGYTNTIGDAYTGRVSGTGPLNVGNMAVITQTTGALTISGSNIIMEGIRYSSTRNNVALVVSTGTEVSFVDCALENNNVNASTLVLSASVKVNLINCDISLLAASGGNTAVSCTGSGSVITGCRITGKTGNGITLGTSMTMVRCVVFNSLIGVNMTLAGGNYTLIDNTITGCTSNGVQLVTGATVRSTFIANSITDNGGYGMEFTTSTNGVILAYPRFRDNIAGDTHLATDWIAATSYHQITTDSGGPETDYVDASTQDYRIVYPSALVGNGPFFSAIGALQLTNTTVNVTSGGGVFGQ